MTSNDPDSGRFIPAPGSSPVSGYVLECLLGKGSFGEVWRATGPGGVLTAIKFIRRDLPSFESENRAIERTKNIAHPNVTGIRGIWAVGNMLVVAMELAERTLLACLEESHSKGMAGIPKEQLHDYMRAAAKGIDHLNKVVGIRHGDIKPENMLIFGGSVKICDLGLARAIEQTSAAKSLSLSPAYAAPELYDGKACEQSDQYSLAISYCHLLGGRLPFTGGMAEILKAHATREPDLSMIPMNEREVVRRALQKEPAQRWPDCTSFVDSLIRSPADDRGYASAAPTLQLPQRRTFSIKQTISAIAIGSVILLTLLVALSSSMRSNPFVDVKRQEVEREVARIRNAPPRLYAAHSQGYKEVDQLPPVDNSAFETISDERFVDMRGWKEVPPEHSHEFYCAVNLHLRQRIKKIGPAETFDSRGRTSGLDLIRTCLSDFPFQEIGQRGDVVTGTDRMKVRALFIDVSKVPEGKDFDLQMMSTFWNTSQTDSELWFGVIGYNKSFKVSQLILFPDHKPFKEYSLMVAPSSKGKLKLYDGPKTMLTGDANDWIYWEILNPREGFVYQLHWKW
jgi:serine/threonine protein kinase